MLIKLICRKKGKIDSIFKLRQISTEEGKELAKEMGCPYVECSARNNVNINKLFHSILVEINRYESNIDFNSLNCKRLLKCFVKNENCLINLLYILLILCLLYSIGFIIIGCMLGTTDLRVLNSIIVGTLLLIGIWNIIFTFLGIFGVKNKKKEFINYVYYDYLTKYSFL